MTSGTAHSSQGPARAASLRRTRPVIDGSAKTMKSESVTLAFSEVKLSLNVVCHPRRASYPD
jgi:hypothetical protein